MKILILGPSACGKTTLAHKIEDKFHISRIEIDDIVLQNEDESERKKALELFLKNNEDWIIDDLGRSLYYKCWDDADIILFIDIKKSVVKFRQIKRYILRKLHIQKNNKDNTLKTLISGLKMDDYYYKEVMPNKKNKLKDYSNKTFYLNSVKQNDLNYIFSLIDNKTNR